MIDMGFHGQFPSAQLIQGMQNKPVLEQQMAAIRQKQMQDALAQLGQGVASISDKKRRMAAAMTMSQSPAVQESLGAGQMVPGSVNADPSASLTTGPGGQAVTPSMTAMGGVGVAPVQNTGSQMQGRFSAGQIEPMLGDKPGADYFGDLQKMNMMQRLQKSFQAKGNVVTPIINPVDGSVTYSTTQVAPGSTVQHPVRLPRPAQPRASGGTDEYNQLLKNREGLVRQRGQFFDANDARAKALDQQIGAINGRLNQLHPLGTPGANTATGTSNPMGGKVPPGYPAAQQGRVYVVDPQGAFHTVPEEQLQDAIDAGFSAY